MRKSKSTTLPDQKAFDKALKAAQKNPKDAKAQKNLLEQQGKAALNGPFQTMVEQAKAFAKQIYLQAQQHPYKETVPPPKEMLPPFPPLQDLLRKLDPVLS